MPDSKYDSSQTLAALIADLSRLMRRSFNRYIRSTGLTHPQWRVIGLLNKTPGVNQAALAERLDIQPISLTRLIDRMEAAGWVERSPHPHDRRAMQLFLTDKAQPILEELRSAGGDFEEEALAGVSAIEQDQLRHILGKIRANLVVADSDIEPATSLSRTAATPSRTKEASRTK